VHPTRLPAPVRCAFAALLVPLAAYVVLLATGTGEGAPQDILYFTIMGCACVLAATRAFVGQDRAVWGLLAAAMILWEAGDAWWELADLPGVSPADALYLAFYALAIPALVLLLRRRATGTLATLWADGWVASLGVASAAAYFFVEPALEGSRGGSMQELLVNLAYPIGDTLLLALVVGGIVATRGRMQRSWAAMCVALVAMAVSDGIYLNLSWSDSYTDGSLLEAGWAVAALCLAWSMWLSYAESAERRMTTDRAPIVWPVLWGGGSLTLVAVLGIADGAHPISIGLAVAGVLSVFGRLMLTDAQNRRLARAASLQALTDPVTGLGNHRALTGDLKTALDTTSRERRVLLALYDLNGFKDYNDRFGHPAGDALLERLGTRLRDVAAPAAHAYRMGGDEFCILAVVDAGVEHGLLLARAHAALTEGGEGFTVSASGGHVLAEPGRTTASAVLRTADERMYASKRSARSSSLQQAADVLAAAAREREPGLALDDDRIARLAEITARELGMDEEGVAHVHHAARLHDVGKLAVPEEILAKPGPLDAAELEFVRTHTLVGERIAAAAPALAPVARLIRSSHERWDGGGYPDGLAGEEIALGARVVFACDAFEAMTSDRAWRPAIGAADAVAELLRNAGTQFDPAVVLALAAALAREDDAPALAA
jgi:two-component system, cell cycle response regulator